MNLEPVEYETENLNTQHSHVVKMVEKHSKEDCGIYIKSHCKNKTGHYTSF